MKKLQQENSIAATSNSMQMRVQRRIYDEMINFCALGEPSRFLRYLCRIRRISPKVFTEFRFVLLLQTAVVVEPCLRRQSDLGLRYESISPQKVGGMSRTRSKEKEKASVWLTRYGIVGAALTVLIAYHVQSRYFRTPIARVAKCRCMPTDKC